MTSGPQEPVDAAEADPGPDQSAAAIVRDEDDLPEADEDEVEVGLGPDD